MFLAIIAVTAALPLAERNHSRRPRSPHLGRSSGSSRLCRARRWNQTGKIVGAREATLSDDGENLTPSNPTPRDPLGLRGDYPAALMGERMKLEFARLGMYYHVAANRSLRLGTIAGNLAHHAVELYLKAFLVRYTSLDDLKNPKKFGHSLPRLWDAFSERTEHRHEGLREAVEGLQSFQDIRYPDGILAEGLLFVAAPPEWPSVEVMTDGTEPTYVLSMNLIGQFAVTVLDEIPLDPGALQRQMLAAEDRPFWIPVH